MITIEYVCTGNNGRSPMAEAIAKDYLHRQRLADKAFVCSSGSGLPPPFQVREYGDLQREMGQNLPIIKLALENGIYQEPWRQEGARSVLEEGYLERRPDSLLLEGLVNYAVRVEGIFRDQALLEIGLVAAGKYHRPTVQGHEGLILTLSESNAVQVREIYQVNRRGNLKPTITTLNQYAGMEGEVPNPFCQLLPAYRQVRDHLLAAVPKTIDRAVGEWV
ncbi:MAG: hypothetical protein AABX13_02805 [Nanoarchaeota archaeon]